MGAEDDSLDSALEDEKDKKPPRKSGSQRLDPNGGWIDVVEKTDISPDKIRSKMAERQKGPGSMDLK